jgi:hypothetical protein
MCPAARKIKNIEPLPLTQKETVRILRLPADLRLGIQKCSSRCGSAAMSVGGQDSRWIYVSRSEGSAVVVRGPEKMLEMVVQGPGSACAELFRAVTLFSLTVLCIAVPILAGVGINLSSTFLSGWLNPVCLRMGEHPSSLKALTCRQGSDLHDVTTVFVIILCRPVRCPPSSISTSTDLQC